MADVNGKLVPIEVDPHGRLAYMAKAAQDAAAAAAPTISAPDGPVTAFGRLLADGWRSPDPELAEVAERIETLRAGWAALRANVTDVRRGSMEDVTEAVRKADRVGFVDAFVGVAIWSQIDRSVGRPDSELALLLWALLKRENELVHRHQDAILASLAGNDSPAAAEVRRFVEEMRYMAVPPIPRMFDTILR
jgi:hypothetical protein